MTKLQTHLAGLVRVGMHKQKMSQKALARRVSMTDKHVSQMLSGRVQGTLEAWQKLLDAVLPEYF